MVTVSAATDRFVKQQKHEDDRLARIQDEENSRSAQQEDLQRKLQARQLFEERRERLRAQHHELIQQWASDSARIRSSAVDRAFLLIDQWFDWAEDWGRHMRHVDAADASSKERTSVEQESHRNRQVLFDMALKNHDSAEAVVRAKANGLRRRLANSVTRRTIEDLEFNRIIIDGRNVNYTAASLLNAEFPVGADLAQSEFIALDMRGTRFLGVHLSSISFLESNLRGARFERCKGRYLDFRSAKMDHLRVKECEFKLSDFRWSEGTSIRIERGIYSGADLREAKFFKPRVRGANFRGSKREHLTIRGGNLEDCRVS